LIEGNVFFTVLTMGTGEYYGLLFRNAVNKHIKETSESTTQNNNDDNYKG